MKKIIMVLLFLFGVMINGILFFAPVENNQNSMTLSIDILAQLEQTYQVFYSTNGEFTESQSILKPYTNSGEVATLEFELPKETKIIRLDLGEVQDNHVISKFALLYDNGTVFDSLEELDSLIVTKTMIASDNWGKEEVAITTNGTDSFFILDFSSMELEDKFQEMEESNRITTNAKKMILFDILYIIVVIVFWKYYHQVKEYFFGLWNNKTVILNLSKNDFKIKYAGSYLGIIWAFIQPLVTIGVYWFVFQVGFRSGNVVEGYPFILWLISGLIPWFFFVEALSSGTNCLLDYNYLVKKVVFPISILPIIRILATYYVHLFFMFFMFIIFFLYGFAPDLYWLQVIYCEVCLLVMLLGLVYATSAMVIFFKDLAQIIVIIVQVGLWLTPILWDYGAVITHPTLAFVLKLNPIFYIIQQYRNALVYQTWFWEDFYWTIYFWIVNILIFGVGVLLFKKLKIHFADVI